MTHLIEKMIKYESVEYEYIAIMYMNMYKYAE